MSRTKEVKELVDQLQHELFFRKTFERVLRDDAFAHQHLLDIVRRAHYIRTRIVTSTRKRGTNGEA